MISRWCPQVRGPLGIQGAAGISGNVGGRWKSSTWPLPRAGKGVMKEPCQPWFYLREAQPRHHRYLHRTAAQGTHLNAGWQPHLHCSSHLRDAGLDHVDQVGNRWIWGRSKNCRWPVWINRGTGWREVGGGFVGQTRHSGRERAISLLCDLQKFIKGLLCAQRLWRAC